MGVCVFFRLKSERNVVVVEKLTQLKLLRNGKLHTILNPLMALIELATTRSFHDKKKTVSFIKKHGFEKEKMNSTNEKEFNEGKRIQRKKEGFQSET